MYSELGFAQTQPSKIMEDNKACIDMLNSKKISSGIRHIDLRIHFIREHIGTNLQLVAQGTQDMIADLFTKNLPWNLFRKHRTSLGLLDLDTRKDPLAKSGSVGIPRLRE